MSTSRRQSEAAPKDSSPEPVFSSDEEAADETEEQKAARLKRRTTREVKYMRTKLTRLKDKLRVAKKERATLKDHMSKNKDILK